MKNFVLTAVKYFVLMNVVLYLGSLLVGGEYEFNLIANVTVPVLCAYVEYEAQHLKGKKFSKQ